MNLKTKYFLLKLTMASKKTTTIKTLWKWEKELKSKFSYELNGNKVCSMM